MKPPFPSAAGVFILSILASAGIPVLEGETVAAAILRFTAPFHAFSTGDEPVAVAAGYLDRDGLLDLATADRGSGSVTILLNRGGGRFARGLTVPAGLGPGAIAVRDLNHDGIADLVVTSEPSNTVSILLGLGDGVFRERRDFPTGEGPVFVTAQDMNFDLYPELVVAAEGSGTVSILTNQGTGFAPRQELRTLGSPRSVGVRDWNGDGLLDLAVVDGARNVVSLFAGLPGGYFGGETGYAVGVSPASLAAGDLNQDGRADLTVTNSGENSISILLAGESGFQERVDLETGPGPAHAVTADLNGDRIPDLAVASRGGSAVNVLWGTPGGMPGQSHAIRAGPGIVAVEGGDFNGDGLMDLAAVNREKSLLSIWHKAPDGSYARSADLDTGREPYSLAVADLNGDGRPDVVVTSFFYTVGEASVFLNEGGGTFAERRDLTTGRYPYSVAIADLNDDGIPDLVTANLEVTFSSISVMIGNGDGSFKHMVRYPTRRESRSVAVGDLNEDGHPDVAVANEGSDDVSVLLGTGDGRFRPQTVYATGEEPYSVVIADVNLDGHNDLVVPNEHSGDVSILWGAGDGTFPRRDDVATGEDPQHAAVGDFDGDRRPDVAVVNEGSGTVSILHNYGDGGFEGKVDLGTWEEPLYVTVADLNEDALPDLAVASESGTVSIHLNSTPQATLLSFTASLQAGRPVLHWSVSDHAGAYRYALERRFGRRVEMVFEALVSTQRDFAFVDEDAPVGRVDYTLIETSPEGEASSHGPRSLTVLPPRMELEPASPNPFVKATTLTYSLVEPGRVRLSIFDVLGREVARLVDRVRTPGQYRVVWEGRNELGDRVSPGVYFARMEVDGRSETHRLVRAP